MRKGFLGLVSAVAIASTMATYGCSASSGGGGGSGGGGSGSGGSTQANCPNGATCGGDVVGTWKVTSSCLNASGDMDVSLSGLGCKTVPATGTLQVTGTWTANKDGTYTDGTTTTGTLTFPLAASCLTISSVPTPCAKIGSIFTALGWAKADCSNNASAKCNCSVT